MYKCITFCKVSQREKKTVTNPSIINELPTPTLSAVNRSPFQVARGFILVVSIKVSDHLPSCARLESQSRHFVALWIYHDQQGAFLILSVFILHTPSSSNRAQSCPLFTCY
jgi:hypothetical protein